MRQDRATWAGRRREGFAETSAVLFFLIDWLTCAGRPSKCGRGRAASTITTRALSSRPRRSPTATRWRPPSSFTLGSWA